MKTLYEFKKTKGEDKFSFIFREPNRDEKQKLSVFYSKTLFDLLKQGMPSVNMLDKLHADNVGGVLSEKEHKEFKQLQEKLFELQKSLEEENSKKTKDLKAVDKIIENLNTVRTRMNELQMQKDSIYNNTAEIFSRNKAVEKLILDFSMFKKDIDGTQYQEFFGDGDYDSKMDTIESMAEDSFYQEAIATLFTVATLYWVHGVTTPDRIKEIMDGIDKGEYGELEEATEDQEVLEVPVEEEGVKKPKK